MSEALLALMEAIERKETAVLATVVEISGASPIKPGAQMTLLADGQTVGTVGGGNLEAAIHADARQAQQSGQPRLAHCALKPEGPDAMDALCGGDVKVFLQPYLPPPRLVIVGGGHIGRPLQAMGALLNFDVDVVDIQPDRHTAPDLGAVTFTSDTYVVLITHDYLSDEAALRTVLQSQARYIGMIGSRAKCRKILTHLTADGYGEANLQRIHAPIGLHLGGPTPAEIALAILAEIVAVRHGALTAQQTYIYPRSTPQEKQDV
jgi:xanthine dehydrogenase accessory factor